MKTKTFNYRTTNGETVNIKVLATIENDLLGPQLHVVSIDPQSKIYPKGFDWYMSARSALLFMTNK